MILNFLSTRQGYLLRCSSVYASVSIAITFVTAVAMRVRDSLICANSLILRIAEPSGEIYLRDSAAFSMCTVIRKYGRVGRSEYRESWH